MHSPAPDLLYRSLPRWDGAEATNLCHGEGMPRSRLPRASHGMCLREMPGGNESPKELPGPGKAPLLSRVPWVHLPELIDPGCKPPPL